MYSLERSSCNIADCPLKKQSLIQFSLSCKTDSYSAKAKYSKDMQWLVSHATHVSQPASCYRLRLIHNISCCLHTSSSSTRQTLKYIWQDQQFFLKFSTCYVLACGAEHDPILKDCLCLQFICLYRWESESGTAIEVEKSYLAYPSQSMKAWKLQRMSWGCWQDSMGKHSSLYRAWCSKRTIVLFLNVKLNALQQDI